MEVKLIIISNILIGYSGLILCGLILVHKIKHDAKVMNKDFPKLSFYIFLDKGRIFDKSQI